ncbi:MULTISPECIES: chemoreceptor glutamine deamidase CheD [Comamonas]|uniref:Probable chemoreceptor glutamine deamidase CheD n=1 Tax=Comamonas thiooxydans TaxID=363952 RepID=A0AA42PZ50_9BURK|nr:MULTISPECIES: chemoreceptor glutamine deamidase CheD [Comamonas]BCX50885.1 putative chemoreceptor glutamine deamidase CheD 1 [Comamonas testosteroni]KKI13858.1 chemotaxis protein CheD [Comamonas thiooxydans]MDH1253865.1 chemoreceptor glutamine deamidase CheD [Comamonas thiooxydans]MDH1334195.1 chemoreceptor glutamine deamidase CheD [Comamonas thiooxydans]MDH1740156.1 chemoreceptor glutamine deamidase CheD [Comamonas thiooxydans]
MRNLSSPLDLPGAGAVRPLRGNSFVPQGYPDAAMPAPVSSLEQLKRQPRQPGEASFFYYDPHFQLNSAKVLPGEYFVSRDEMAIVTVLGSCIAACLWDRFMRIGGMNHFMLPDGDSSDVSGRYGSYAMELLINEMLKLGARRESMQAKIFGGAQVMANFTTMNVGERNTSFVTEYLQTERIPIVSEDVLDIYPRKVVFFPSTGKAMVKRLAHAHPEALVQQEITRGNAAAVARNTAGGSVDLF